LIVLGAVVEFERELAVELLEEEEELDQHLKVCSRKTWDRQLSLASEHIVSFQSKSWT